MPRTPSAPCILPPGFTLAHRRRLGSLLLGAVQSSPWSYPSARRRPPGPGCKYPAPGQPAAKSVAAVPVDAATAAATVAAAAAVAKAAAAAAMVTAVVVTVVPAAAAAAAAVVALTAAVQFVPYAGALQRLRRTRGRCRDYCLVGRSSVSEHGMRGFDSQHGQLSLVREKARRFSISA